MKFIEECTSDKKPILHITISSTTWNDEVISSINGVYDPITSRECQGYDREELDEDCDATIWDTY